jgi:hypothetical protein
LEPSKLAARQRGQFRLAEPRCAARLQIERAAQHGRGMFGGKTGIGRDRIEAALLA